MSFYATFGHSRRPMSAPPALIGKHVMAKFQHSLDRVKIAAPCNADWEQMFSFEGERVRFCSQCNLNVYNLSAMTHNEATALLYKTEGRLCVRFYRRSDGTILTQNCPVGLRALKRRAAWVAQVVLGMIMSSLGGLGLFSLKPFKRLVEPVETIVTMGMAGVPSSSVEKMKETEVMGMVPIDTTFLKERAKKRARRNNVSLEDSGISK